VPGSSECRLNGVILPWTLVGMASFGRGPRGRPGSNTSDVTHAIGDQQVMCLLAIRASPVFQSNRLALGATATPTTASSRESAQQKISS
jgi:hypothetical protein